jgi:hypothetical protein
MRYIQWVWILLVLCHTSCNGCKQYKIPYAEDQWGAAIAIKPTSSGGATFLGSINGLPALSLHGTISKNVPGVSTAYLCALFVPDGEAPDAGAKAIQGHTVKSDSHSTSSGTFALGKLHKLPNGSFVQYARPLGPDETGDIDFLVASYDADDSLVLGTAYNIYLGIKVGPHFFYTAGAHASYTHPNNALAPTQVTMVSASCVQSRAPNGKILPLLSAEATATNLPNNNATTGFLCIKQGTNLPPVGVFSKQLAPGSTPLPTTSNILTAHPDSTVVCCAVVPVTTSTSYSIANLQDTNNALELGATYDVYGYIVVDGCNYYVSKNSYTITLPEVEIKVTMDTIGDPKLIAIKQNSSGVDYAVSEFQLELSGHIDKIDNAKDPIAGFVFVAVGQVQDKESVCQTIQGAICSTSASIGNVIDVGNNKNHVVCIALTTGITATQQISHTCNLQNGTSSYLDLTKDYHVYFWVQDAKGYGELFLSDNYQMLNIFHVGDGNIPANVGHSRVGNELTIRPNVDTHNLRNENGYKMGVFFLGNYPKSLTRQLLERLRSNLYQPVDPSNPQRLQLIWANKPCFLYKESTNSTFCSFPNAGNGSKEIKAINKSDLTPKENYNLGLVMLQGQVFYGINTSSSYTTPEYLESTSSVVVKLSSGNGVEEKVALDFEQGHAYLMDERGLKTKLTDPQKIKQAIDVYYSEDGDRENAYQAFDPQPSS